MKFTNEQRLNYIKRLVGKIFKMLPIRENSEEDFNNYYKSILSELEGAQDLIFSDSFYFVDLVAKINGLPALFFDEKNSAGHRDYKKRIMECIDVVDKIREELIDGQGNKK